MKSKPLYDIIYHKGTTLDFTTSLLMTHTLIGQYTHPDNRSSFAS